MIGLTRKTKDLVGEAKAATPLNPDGGFDIAQFLLQLEQLIELNAGAKRRLARQLYEDSKERADDEGEQRMLPDLGPYRYNPNSLVQDDEGHAIEVCKATLPYIQAEARRARKNASAALVSADRKQDRADAFTEWCFERREAGDDPRMLTWGRFVEEKGVPNPIAQVDEEEKEDQQD
jgi:hypothetical protein